MWRMHKMGEHACNPDSCALCRDKPSPLRQLHAKVPGS